MASVTATDARREFFEIIRRALHGHEVVRIHHREGGVVLISQEEYDGLLETLELLSTPGFRESIEEAEADIAAGRTTSLEELLGDV